MQLYALLYGISYLLFDDEYETNIPIKPLLVWKQSIWAKDVVLFCWADVLSPGLVLLQSKWCINF